MIDEKTINKNYPLPYPSNIASQDVARIANAIAMVDADIAGCEDSIKEIEDTAEDESDIASTTNFGRVKIGSGINVTDGKPVIVCR